jgi:hypothetical protein
MESNIYPNENLHFHPLNKTTIFTYEIKHFDPLSQKLSLSITSNTFFHTLHGKYSKLQTTLHDLHWFLILIHSLLSYNCNTKEGKQIQNSASI